MVLTAFVVLPSAAQVRITGHGPSRCIAVNGRPMIMLAGELSNSAATCKADIDSVLPRMSREGLNTVLVPAQWDLTEPAEGQFDFSLIDETINLARQNNLAFSANVLDADRKAFTTLLRHIADVDGREHTVVMMQVENEIGMLESARDHSPLAEKAFAQGEWRKWLDKLNVDKADQRFVDEAFQAYYYARYVEQMAVVGKKILDIPFYVNAAMNSRGRKPGEYPSAGPLAHLFPIWKAVAPHIDLCAPDIYDTGYKGWTAQYATANNTLFIPESRMCENSGVRGLYTFGEHNAIGFGPFAIDEAPASLTKNVTKAYGLMGSLFRYIQANASKNLTSWGLLFAQDDKERVIVDGDNVLTCRHYFTLPWDPRATDGSTWSEGGAYVLRVAPDEYLIAGSGVVVVFQTKEERQQAESVKTGEDGFALAGQSGPKSSADKRFKGHRLGIGYVDEVKIDDNGYVEYVRRENGDQDHQGRHARIAVGDYKILHVKLYPY